MLSTRLSRDRRASGMTLFELVVVIALVIALLAIVINVGVAVKHSSDCKKALDKAKAAVASCTNSSSWNKDSALTCLADAQTALDAYLRECEPSNLTRQALKLAATDLNTKVDELKGNLESDEDKAKLEKAKIKVPD